MIFYSDIVEPAINAVCMQYKLITEHEFHLSYEQHLLYDLVKGGLVIHGI